LAEFGVPVLLLSGGEPLTRGDIFELAEYAHTLGIRTTLSTNGTLITPDVAQRIKEVGFGYVGISIDGIGEHNDKFRGKRGAYAEAMEGIRNCRAIGQRVGLRMTLTRRNLEDMPAIFDLIEQENIDRACFYHLAYTGRGRRITQFELSHEETRASVVYIFNRTLDFHRRGLEKEILTVDNHVDGPLLYLKVKEEQGPERAQEVWDLLMRNGGNNSGVAIGHIDNLGNVHPDQFTWSVELGNVLEQPFSKIWQDTSNPMVAGLKNRSALLPQRCQECRFLEMCNGNFRARALFATGDFWGMDPACYLTDEEIKVPARV
ncbi:MAG: putative heme d1 biosynthesis radical protein NirJ1, partial [Dehalococcoidia bacterium]|nr:putative heme d1 biosynthesis radical protein NirJ1 [Dehalococcoidia bacterium]